MSELKKEYVIDNAHLMVEWVWEKNINVTPNELTVGSNKKVWWKCEKGHSWNMSPYEKVKSKGCPFCLNKRVLIGFNDLGTLFPNLAKEWDFEKNQIDIELSY